MQSVSSQFTARAQGSMRRLSWGVRMAFDKAFDDDITFFTLDQSLLDGPDVLAPTEDSVINLWDKYEYTDYSNRVVSIDWSREDELPSSVSLAMADVVFDNHDGFFTPGGGSAIEDFIIPRRPIRVYAGFGGENVSVFVGLSEKMPVIDKRAGTAAFHCIDFLSYLFDRPLDETVLLEDVRTNEVLDYLLQLLGVDSDAYSLDYGYNKMSLFFTDKGRKFGDIARELMEAEIGRLYMDEQGVIRFRNRYSFSTIPVYDFGGSNTIESGRGSQDGIINVVEVKAKVREVQALQSYWELQSPVMVPASGSVEVWADFDDPVTSAVAPAYIASATSSSFTTNRNQDSSGSAVTSGISVLTTTFDKSMLLTFSNSNGFDVWITASEIYATPARVVKDIYIREQDNDSVDKYEERVYTVDNEFIQSEAHASSLALFLLREYSGLDSSLELSVKGSPALQMGDAINTSTGVHVLAKIEGTISEARFTQRLRGRQINPTVYFTLDHSLLDGPDVLAP